MKVHAICRGAQKVPLLPISASILDDRKPPSVPATPRPEEAVPPEGLPADTVPSAEQDAPGNVKGLFKQVGQKQMLSCHA